MIAWLSPTPPERITYGELLRLHWQLRDWTVYTTLAYWRKKSVPGLLQMLRELATLTREVKEEVETNGST